MRTIFRTLLMGMLLFFCCASSAFAQYVFEGTVRDFSDYGQPNLSSATVDVYQLDSDMLPLTSGNNLVPATITQYSSTWTPSNGNTRVTAVNGVFYFIGSAPAYLLKFTSGSKEFEFIWLSHRSSPISVKDFGPTVVATEGTSASTIDTRALSSAVAYLAGHNGGKLIVPTGYYKVGADYTNCNSCATQSFNGIPLPSGIIIEGSNPGSASNCLIELQMASKSLFKIGEKTDRVTVRDITLKATSYTGTKAIAASGAAPAPSPSPTPTSSTEFMFSNLTVGGFDRGLSIEATDNDHGWQCNNVRVDHCTFTAKYGIYTDTINTDMHISNVEVNVKPGGSGIHIKRAGFLLIENTIGGGITESGSSASNFIYLAVATNVQIENTECEEFTNALNVEYPSGTGSPGFPSTITLINNLYGLPVLLNRDVSLVSIGNWYCDGTVQTTNSSAHLEIYSFGDHACLEPGNSFPNNSHPECTAPSSGVCDPFDDSLSSKVVWKVGPTGPFASGSKIGVGTSTPGASMSAAESVVEIEAKTSGNLPWLVLKGPGSTHERWGWTVSGGKLYLQDIGSANILTVDQNGNVSPATASTGSLGDSGHKWGSIYGVNIYQGDSILTDKQTGEQLYRIREDQNTIIFEDFRTGKEMMRVDREGNLYVKGRVFQGTSYEDAVKKRKPAPRKKRRARR